MESNASHAALLPSVTEEIFLDALDCYYFYVKRNFTYHEANNRCFTYGNPFVGATVNRAFMGIFGVLIVLFNSCVLWGILGTKQLRKAMYFYIANLAVADLVSGVVCMYLASRPDATGLWERLSARTFIGLAMLLSTTALTLLSIDRYVSIVHPVVYHNKVTGRQACVVILASWVVIVPMTFSSLMGWNCLEKDYALSGGCASYLTLGYIIFVVVMLLLLVCVTLWANIYIYRAVKRMQNRNLGGPRATRPRRGASNSAMDTQPQPGPSKQPDKPSPPFNNQNKIQKARAVMTVVLIAFVSWLLYFVFLGAHRICEAYRNTCPIRGIAQWGLLLAFLNSLVNPIVHGLRVPALKTAVLAKFNAIREAVVAVVIRERVGSATQRRQKDNKGQTSSEHTYTYGSQQVAYNVGVSLEILTPTGNRGDQSQDSDDGQHTSGHGQRTLAWP
ncbi:CNR1 [Branchiostoma lanceolatum]|uniref:CNR1 protein n=1 Tax=Branchiostoma lanceolatum TaxID=7740 RepID=A0A8J9ZAB6_BRALA|nr:CNR1 [Branchiostoma lanceolatum]